jgi:hypothetical protein
VSAQAAALNANIQADLATLGLNKPLSSSHSNEENIVSTCEGPKLSTVETQVVENDQVATAEVMKLVPKPRYKKIFDGESSPRSDVCLTGLPTVDEYNDLEISFVGPSTNSKNTNPPSSKPDLEQRITNPIPDSPPFFPHNPEYNLRYDHEPFRPRSPSPSPPTPPPPPRSSAIEPR